MISSDGIRGYNDMIILRLILEEPSYGYEISKAIKEKAAANISSKRPPSIRHLQGSKKTVISNLFSETKQTENGGLTIESQIRGAAIIRKNAPNGI